MPSSGAGNTALKFVHEGAAAAVATVRAMHASAAIATDTAGAAGGGWDR